MAALQKIRNTGPFLIIALGLALFGFVAGDWFKVFDVFANSSKQTIGEIMGETYKYPQFQKDVDKLTEIVKFQKMMQGQSPELSNNEQEQIRMQAWQMFKHKQTIEKEAKEAGLEVTKEDIQNAFLAGTAPSLRMIANIFPTQDGRLDFQAYQKFMKDFDITTANLRNQGNVQALEQYMQIRNVCDFALEQLSDELLQQKFYGALTAGVVSNKVNAEVEYANQNTLSDGQVVAFPLNLVDNKEVKIEDSELQSLYDDYKVLFKNPMKSVELQMLDFVVEPSVADKAKLEEEVSESTKKFEAGEDAATVVGASKSEMPYNGLYKSEKAFAQHADIQVKDMKVGEVKPAYFNESDNTVTTYKLVGKTNAADKVSYKMIVAAKPNAEESKVLADSIMTALKDGADFKTLAKKYVQKGDTTTIESKQYETASLPSETAQLINTINSLSKGLHIIDVNHMSAVIDVISRENVITKYDVAVVKCPLKFSKETYNKALNKMNKFLAANSNLKDFKANAGKEGYIVRPVHYSQDRLDIQNSIGGTQAKEAFKWVFDASAPGELSKLYECGNNNNHLLVIGVDAVNADEYLPWDNKNIKEFLTRKLTQEKKAELLAARLKDVKTFADAEKQDGAIVDSLKQTAFSLTQPINVAGVNVPEPKLTGAIAKTQKDGFTGLVKGEGAIYFAQIAARTMPEAKMDSAQVETMEQQIAARMMQQIFTQSYFGPQEVLINRLMTEFGKEQSFLYRF